ncbi:MAG TPA: hypothetical protein VIM09_07600 [Chthoniobacterales bacterium]
MADPAPTNIPAAAQNNTPAVSPGQGPGADLVSVSGILGLTSYLAVMIAFCLYGLIVFWPTPTPSGQTTTQPAAGPKEQIDSTTSASPSPSASARSTPAASPSATPGKVSAFGREFKIWDEVRLLWIVILAGALGSLIHAVRSVYWYVGNRNLVRSWLAKYFVMPFTGSALAVMFYFVIRGGFFSPQSDFSQTSPFGFAALSAMVGLFSEQAVLKLKQVAETILSKPESGADPMPPNKTPPSDGNDAAGS